MSLNKKISEIFRQLEYPNWPDEATIGQIGDVGYKYLSICFSLDEIFSAKKFYDASTF